MWPGDDRERLTFAELLARLRPAWHADAYCAGTSDLPWIPKRGHYHGQERCAALCDVCPVRMECLTFALADPTLAGMWAGTTARVRDAARRQGWTAARLLTTLDHHAAVADGVGFT